MSFHDFCRQNRILTQNSTVPRKKNNPPRRKFTAYVLPETEKRIKSKVVKGNREKDTPGKVIDLKFRRKS